MKFSIITPTFRRKEKLERAVASVLAQTYKDWEMIIINDSPTDTAYQLFAATIQDQRIRYYVNTDNRGVNYSRNRALSLLSADSRWVIFLDDDDYLAPDCLATFAKLIHQHSEQKWFVTNRALSNGTSLTTFPHDEHVYSYAWSYLLLKRCKGDATHCIESKLITTKKILFSQLVKQGEEWFFFYQLGLLSGMYYYDHNSTISDGYDAAHGLNFRTRTLSEQIETLTKLFYEGVSKSLTYKATFSLYLLLRLIKLMSFKRYMK